MKKILPFLYLFALAFNPLLLADPAPTSMPTSMPMTNASTNAPAVAVVQDASKIEIISFNTYDFEPSAPGSEKYSSTSFPKSTTTYVYARVEFKNDLYNVQNQTYRFTYKFYDQNNRLMTAFDADFLVQKDWEYAYHYGSWGFTNAGLWDVGSYRAELWLGNTKIGDAKFNITNN